MLSISAKRKHFITNKKICCWQLCLSRSSLIFLRRYYTDLLKCWSLEMITIEVMVTSVCNHDISKSLQ